MVARRLLLCLPLLLGGCDRLVPFAPAHAGERGGGTGAAWDGSYTVIGPGAHRTTTPPDAYTPVLLDNLGNGTATVRLTAGAAISLQLPPETNTPVFYIDDFAPSPLGVFAQSRSPIGAQVVGIGVGTVVPRTIVLEASLELPPGAFAQGTSNPNLMNLRFETTTGALTTFLLLGGVTPGAHPTTRAVVIQLNAPANLGPAMNAVFDNTLPQPTGSSLDPAAHVIYGATTSAQYNLLYNWGGGTILITNVSGATAAGATITLSSVG